MPFGRAAFPAPSSFTRGYLAQRWRAHPHFIFRNANAPTQELRYSSIANAMLGRAIKAKATEPQAPTPKDDAKKKAITHNNMTRNGNIQDSLKPKPKSSQAIGGFIQPLRPASANGKTPPKESQSIVALSTTSSHLSSLLSRDDSFKDTPNSSFDLVQFDSDDLSDDDNIDFDISYALPTYPLSTNASMPAPPKPIRPTIPLSPFTERKAERA
ncbi:hypothetical protein EYC80_008828 [Monilinia laxa]|uniref:Uncharacterized protein n=1 Tax=Monilinia laxa TaxID=61186 RepID=A0A5N6K1I0_MONLA|nr:hypothetical protein EYC80_008828 [Monilinia laxa]